VTPAFAPSLSRLGPYPVDDASVLLAEPRRSGGM
jgi:hypothetical protein